MFSIKISIAVLVAMLSFSMCLSKHIDMMDDMAEVEQATKKPMTVAEEMDHIDMIDEVAEVEQATKKPMTVAEEMEEALGDEETDADLEGADAQTYHVGSYSLRLNSGQSDYASLAGTYYKLSTGLLRGKPIYRNAYKKRIMFYTGSRWVITSDTYIFTVLNGGTGGFYGSKNTKAGVNSLYTNYCGRRLSIWKPRYN